MHGIPATLLFHLVAFMVGVSQEKWWAGRVGAGESKISNNNGGELLRRPSSSYRKLMDIVSFRILSTINDEAPL